MNVDALVRGGLRLNGAPAPATSREFRRRGSNRDRKVVCSKPIRPRCLAGRAWTPWRVPVGRYRATVVGLHAVQECAVDSLSFAKIIGPPPWPRSWDHPGRGGGDQNGRLGRFVRQCGTPSGRLEAPQSTAQAVRAYLRKHPSEGPSSPSDRRSKYRGAPRQAVRPPDAYFGFCRGRYDSPSTTSSWAAFLSRSTAVWARSGSASMASHSAGSRLDVTIIEPARCRSTMSS